jgi:hypothetical protein
MAKRGENKGCGCRLMIYVPCVKGDTVGVVAAEGECGELGIDEICKQRPAVEAEDDCGDMG